MDRGRAKGLKGLMLSRHYLPPEPVCDPVICVGVDRPPR
jgi:hypothetical protein